MSWKPKFKKGDIVISNKGTKPLKITYAPEYSYSWYRGKYLHNDRSYEFSTENEKNYTLYEDPEMTNVKTLYSFTKADGTTGYGTHIGTNSQNQYLIEEKTTHEIHVLNKDDLEEVLPYTFSVEMEGTEYHYIGKPDTLKVGDLLLNTEAKSVRVAVVKALDTKNKTPRAKFKGRKLVTAEI
jgi:hypothetical protein